MIFSIASILETLEFLDTVQNGCVLLMYVPVRREPAGMKFHIHSVIPFFIFSEVRYYRRGCPRERRGRIIRSETIQYGDRYAIPRAESDTRHDATRVRRKKKCRDLSALPHKWKCSAWHDNCSRRYAFARFHREARSRVRSKTANQSSGQFRLVGWCPKNTTHVRERRLKINFAK